jgi:hypothetical protein
MICRVFERTDDVGGSWTSSAYDQVAVLPAHAMVTQETRPEELHEGVRELRHRPPYRSSFVHCVMSALRDECIA